MLLSKKDQDRTVPFKMPGLRLPSAALHSLIAAYYHASFDAKARTNGLCWFFAPLPAGLRQNMQKKLPALLQTLFAHIRI